MKRKKIVTIIICIAVILLIIGVIINLTPIKDRIGRIINVAKREEESIGLETQATYEIIQNEENSLIGLLRVENARGIEKVIIGEEEYYCNGKPKIAFDREIINDGTFTIKVKVIDREEEEFKIEEISEKKISMLEYNEETGISTIEIIYPEIEGTTNYYSIDGGQTWKQYTEPFIVNTAKIPSLYTKSTWNDIGTINVTPYSNSGLEQICGDSLLNVVKYRIGDNGNYTFTINGETYTIHAYVYDEDLTITSNTTFGDSGDVGTSSSYAKNMVVVKVNGDLTINSGVTLTSYGTSYGGPKGMLIYVKGTLTNNGTISMTARGAYSIGQNVYLWKNEDSSYEYVPATGATGGAKKSAGTKASSGNAGGAGSARKTGGGRKRCGWFECNIWSRRNGYIIFWRNRRRCKR